MIKKIKIINCHAHLDSLAQVEKEIDIWRRKGIVHSCLSALGPYWGKATNKDVKKAFLKYPREIVGFGYIRLGIDKPILVDKLRDEGFVGLKIIWPISDYSDKEYFKIYEKAERYRMPILFHTGYVARRELMKDIHIERMRPVHLDTIARYFPELKIIGAHLGNPWFEEATKIASSHPHIYFDLSGGTVPTFPKAFFQMLWSRVKRGEPDAEPFIDENIISKIVYGSDGDIEGTLKFYMNLFKALNIKENIQQKILYGNMVELLRFK